MAWAELVLEYVKALVWPVVTLALVLAFRPQLKRVIEGISEVTGLGFSLKSRSEDLKERALEVNAADDGKRAGLPRDPAVVDPFGLAAYLDLVEDDPEGAIQGCWRRVRSVLRDATRELRTDRLLQPGALTSQHVRSLVPLGLPEDMVGVARELSNLRADVAKGRRIRTDSQAALNYIVAAEQLLSAVQKVRDGAPPAVTG